MPDQPLATVSFPGLQRWESAEITDVAGISPATCMIEAYAPFNTLQLTGDLVLSQGANVVTFKRCRVDSVMFRAGSGGQSAVIKILDERWAWTKGYTVSGRYNLRFPTNKVDPTHEKTPKELAEILLARMGNPPFVLDILENDPNIKAARPLAEWDVANPAQELQRLCEEFELQIVPRRTDGKYVICRTGAGAELPAGLPFQDPSEGIDPNEDPQYITVYGAPIQYQCRIEMEAIGREIFDPRADLPEYVGTPLPQDKPDGSWKLPDDLTYIPVVDGNDPPKTWKHEGPEFEGLSDTKGILQDDGSVQYPQHLAKQYLWRAYRPKEGEDGTIHIPCYTDPYDGTSTVTRKQIKISSVLAEEFINQDGVRGPKPAFCDFIGWHPLLTEMSKNTAPGTRLDVQSTDPQDPNEVVTFSVNEEQNIVIFSSQLILLAEHGEEDVVKPAKVFLNCAVLIRDPRTWQFQRYKKTKPLPGAEPLDDPYSEPGFTRPIRIDELKYWRKDSWMSSPGQIDGAMIYQGTSDNREDADKQADYYLNAELDALQRPVAKTVTYIGIYPIDMDGAINQISYSVTKSGADTKASRGTEHDVRIPAYKDQMQRIKRTELEEQRKEADRKTIAAAVAAGPAASRGRYN